MDKEKICKNCVHYQKHYSIYKTRLKEVGGRCLHDKIYPYYHHRKFVARTDCQYWQSGETVRDERRDGIIKEICAIKRTLSDIALILKNWF